MPVIKFKSEWRDFKPGEIVDTLNERICGELIAANVAERFELEVKDQKAVETSLAYKQASLKSLESMVAYHTRELKKLEAKKNALLMEIKEAEDALAEMGDASSAKKKLLRNKNLKEE